MNLTINGLSVLPVLGSVTLEKSRGEAAASLSATIWTAAADTYFLHLSLAVGDAVHLTDDDGTERFSGSIHTLRRTPERIDLTAFDQGVFLTRNEVWGVFAGSGAEICRAVAEKLGIGTGTLEADSAYQVLPALSGKSAFSLLQQAAGSGREITIEDGLLTVKRSRPVTFPLSTEHVEEVSASADISSMVNRCTVVDYKGRTLAEAQNGAHRAAYGTFQTVLGKAGESPASQAEAALQGRLMRAEVVLSGNPGYRCGCFLRGSQPQWGLDGTYLISAVCHRWEDGRYTTELTLEGVE